MRRLRVTVWFKQGFNMIGIGGRKRQIDAEPQSNLEEWLLQSGVGDAKTVKIWNKTTRKVLGRKEVSDMAVRRIYRRSACNRRKVVLLSTRWKQTQKNWVPFCWSTMLLQLMVDTCPACAQALCQVAKDSHDLLHPVLYHDEVVAGNVLAVIKVKKVTAMYLSFQEFWPVFHTEGAWLYPSCVCNTYNVMPSTEVYPQWCVHWFEPFTQIVITVDSLFVYKWQAPRVSLGQTVLLHCRSWCSVNVSRGAQKAHLDWSPVSFAQTYAPRPPFLRRMDSIPLLRGNGTALCRFQTPTGAKHITTSPLWQPRQKETSGRRHTVSTSSPLGCLLIRMPFDELYPWVMPAMMWCMLIATALLLSKSLLCCIQWKRWVLPSKRCSRWPWIVTGTARTSNGRSRGCWSACLQASKQASKQVGEHVYNGQAKETQMLVFLLAYYLHRFLSGCVTVDKELKSFLALQKCASHLRILGFCHVPLREACQVQTLHRAQLFHQQCYVQAYGKESVIPKHHHRLHLWNFNFWFVFIQVAGLMKVCVCVCVCLLIISVQPNLDMHIHVDIPKWYSCGLP